MEYLQKITAAPTPVIKAEADIRNDFPWYNTSNQPSHVQQLLILKTPGDVHLKYKLPTQKCSTLKLRSHS
jgi:hypothetical protein